MGQYTNPYYYWWKVRKYWKMPKIHLAHLGKVTWWHGLPTSINYYSKYFDIRLRGLGWKDKCNYPSYEWDPYLCFTFFRKFQIIFTWNFCPYFYNHQEYNTINMFTWEAILAMVNYGKNITDACHDFGEYQTFNYCENPDYEIPVTNISIIRNLTDFGIQQYYKIPRSEQLKKLKNY